MGVQAAEAKWPVKWTENEAMKKRIDGALLGNPIHDLIVTKSPFLIQSVRMVRPNQLSPSSVMTVILTYAAVNQWPVNVEMEKDFSP